MTHSCQNCGRRSAVASMASPFGGFTRIRLCAECYHAARKEMARKVAEAMLAQPLMRVIDIMADFDLDDDEAIEAIRGAKVFIRQWETERTEARQ